MRPGARGDENPASTGSHPEIARIALSDGDFVALSAFLRALNEDYE